MTKNKFKLPDMDRKVIQAMKKHLAEGYYKEQDRVDVVCCAIDQGKISLSREVDDFWQYEDLAGDCFNPIVNTDCDPVELQREERNFKARIRSQGVWTMVSRYWTGRAWEDLMAIDDNVIGGFVGNDFFGSGYELQIMEAALAAYQRQELDLDGFVIDPYRRVA